MIAATLRTRMCTLTPGITCGNGDKEIVLINWPMLTTR